jgi:hypothetical protein
VRPELLTNIELTSEEQALVVQLTEEEKNHELA